MSGRDDWDAWEADGPPPAPVAISGGQAGVGARVRLRPAGRADAFDLLLEGKTARVEAIRRDLEGRTYLVVAVDDDPGRQQEGQRVLPGHRFFFSPEEAELMEEAP